MDSSNTYYKSRVGLECSIVVDLIQMNLIHEETLALFHFSYINFKISSRKMSKKIKKAK